MARHGIQAINLNGTQFPGVSGFQFDAGQEVDAGGLDGLQHVTMLHEILKKPMADLQTRSLKAMLAALNDSTDLPQKAFNGTTGLQMILGKAASGSPGYASGSVHTQRMFPRGLIYLAGLSWSKGGKGEYSLKALARGNGDGLTASVTESLVALPSQPATDFGFGLYELTCGGDVITTAESLELSIEPNYEHEYLVDLPEPVDIVGAGVRNPLAIQLRADIGDVDLGDGTGTVSMTFRRYAQGGGFGSDGVVFTLNGVWSSEQGLGGRTNSPGSRSLLVRTRYDGVTKPLTWSTL